MSGVSKHQYCNKKCKRKQQHHHPHKYKCVVVQLQTTGNTTTCSSRFTAKTPATIIIIIFSVIINKNKFSGENNSKVFKVVRSYSVYVCVFVLRSGIRSPTTELIQRLEERSNCCFLIYVSSDCPLGPSSSSSSPHRIKVMRRQRRSVARVRVS